MVLDAANKTDLHLLAYSGATAPSVIGLAQDGSSNTHVAPAVTSPNRTSWVVRYWADKTSTTTMWTAPPGVVQRDSLVGTGSGRVDTLLARLRGAGSVRLLGHRDGHDRRDQRPRCLGHHRVAIHVS